MQKILCTCALLALTSCSGTLVDLSPSAPQSDTEPGIVHSKQFDLMWQRSRSESFSTAEEAKEYAETLSLGGFTDWRLPTKGESHNLYFSLDFGKVKPKDLGMETEGAFWIQTEEGEVKPGEWDGGETCCIVRTFLEAGNGRVRAVRP